MNTELIVKKEETQIRSIFSVPPCTRSSTYENFTPGHWRGLLAVENSASVKRELAQAHLHQAVLGLGGKRDDLMVNVPDPPAATASSSSSSISSSSGTRDSGGHAVDLPPLAE